MPRYKTTKEEAVEAEGRPEGRTFAYGRCRSLAPCERRRLRAPMPTSAPRITARCARVLSGNGHAGTMGPRSNPQRWHANRLLVEGTGRRW